MKQFLRYNSRHMLHFPRDGRLPELNPVIYSSHSTGGKRTFNLDEPTWLFKLRQRLFCFAGHHRCGRRGESLHGQSKAFGGHKQLPDTWDIGPDDNRTCSYCGSIHPDDLMAICRKTINDSRYGVEGTTKSYKVYVRQPGVRNASEGAIKFYMCHAPTVPKLADQQLFANATQITRERFAERYGSL